MFQSRRVFFLISLILSIVFLQLACSQQSSQPSLVAKEQQKAITTTSNSNNPTAQPTNESKSVDAQPTENIVAKESPKSEPQSKRSKDSLSKLKADKNVGRLDVGVEGGVDVGVVGGVVGGVVSSPMPPPPPPPAKSFSAKIATKQQSESLARENQNSEEYTKYSINKMTSTKEDRFSTFSIDVDTASYTIARRKLTEGVLPPAQSVRVEEFVNYFQYNYPNPVTEHPFSVTMEASSSPFNQNRQLLRIGVKGRVVDAEQRPTTHLTFLIDTSGSMQQDDKIGYVKESLRTLVENLRPTDTVAISTYAGGVKLVLPPTSAAHKDLIISSLYQLEAGGGTAMESGIQLAYQQAFAQLQQAKKDDINRIIICSDGDANIGKTSPTELLKQIEGYVKQGITVSTIGFGMGNYKDAMMEQFANKGNGNYFYIDSLQESRRVFKDRLTSNLQVIAKDVKIQVEFDPSTVANYRLVGYENRDIADEDFRNDKVDAGEIGPGHTVTALYELELNPQVNSTLATVRLRYKAPNGEKAKEVSTIFTYDRLKPNFSQTSEDYRFSVAVAAFAEILRGSKEARNWSLTTIANIVKESNSSKLQERKEFLSLVNRAQEIKTHLAPQ